MASRLKHGFRTLGTLLCVLLILPTGTALADGSIGWRQISQDLAMKQVTVSTSAIFNAELLAFKTELKHFKLGVVQASDFGSARESVKALAYQSKALLMINANFFDEQGRALGLVVNRGVLRNPIHQGGNTLTGLITSSHLGVQISHRSDRIPSSVLEAAQAGPRLILKGKRLEDLTASDRTRRSAACIDSKGGLIIVISSGLIGITLHELQTSLLSAELNCWDALNLDGGGSSQIFVNLSSLLADQDDIFISGRDPVPVALGLFAANDN
jgi:exopolysaccharide biosynthesis protein